MYVVPLVAGQRRDGSVFCVGVTVAILLDCVAVVGVIVADIDALLVSIMVNGALFGSAVVAGASLGGEQGIST